MKKLWGEFAIAIAVPIAAGVFGYCNTKAATAPVYVGMAVELLQSPPADATQPLRSWAIELLKEHSNVELTDEQQRALLNNPLPPGQVLVQVAGHGSICAGLRILESGDTAEFVLPTYDRTFGGEPEAILWIHPKADRRAVIYEDTIPFDGELRARVPTEALGPGTYVAEMWFVVGNPLQEFEPNERPFASGACEFIVNP